MKQFYTDTNNPLACLWKYEYAKGRISFLELYSFFWLQSIKRADYTAGSPVQDVGVNHCGAYIAVAK